jgi:single-strand DNA-binding protein
MINEATLIARIGKKSVKQLKTGKEMVQLSVATNDSWIDPDGIKQESTTWHYIHLFGKLAEQAKAMAQVGQLLFIRGKINNKQIESGERKGQWVSSITASQFKFLDRPNDAPAAKSQIKDPYDFSDDVDF